MTEEKFSPGRPVSTGFPWKVRGGSSVDSSAVVPPGQGRNSYFCAGQVVGNDESWSRLSGDEPDSGGGVCRNAGLGQRAGDVDQLGLVPDDHGSVLAQSRAGAPPGGGQGAGVGLRELSDIVLADHQCDHRLDR